jgi:hypothetical protein
LKKVSNTYIPTRKQKAEIFVQDFCAEFLSRREGTLFFGGSLFFGEAWGEGYFAMFLK